MRAGLVPPALSPRQVRRHFDLDAHCRVYETGDDHRRGRGKRTERCAQLGPAWLEIGTIGAIISDADNIGEAGASFGKRRADDTQGIGTLAGSIRRQVTGFGVAPHGPGNKYERPADDGAGIADPCFIRRSRQDAAPAQDGLFAPRLGDGVEHQPIGGRPLAGQPVHDQVGQVVGFGEIGRHRRHFAA